MLIGWISLPPPTDLYTRSLMVASTFHVKHMGYMRLAIPIGDDTLDLRLELGTAVRWRLLGKIF